MSYSPQHKQKIREKIVETARKLFNLHGVKGVSIDEIMKQAGLTRGGFYNHFNNKEELFAESVEHFLMGRGARWREEAGVTAAPPGSKKAFAMIEGYLATKHLEDMEGQCPMIALPTDVAHAGPQVKKSYQKLLEAMVGLFESNLNEQQNARQTALVLATICVGGMVLSKAVNDTEMADEVRQAAETFSYSLLSE